MKLPRWAKIALGALFILIGLLGLVLPLLQGLFFLAAGLLLLSEAVPPLRRKLRNVEERYPKLHRMLRRLRRKDGRLDLRKLLTLTVIISALCIAAFYLARHFA